MKKTLFTVLLSLALALSLTACGKTPAAGSEVPATEPQTAEAAPENAEPEETAASAETATPAPSGRQDGERFEGVIVIEGMEETVPYEHIRNEALGFEMDYDYESFSRKSEADRECFVSVWDDPANPENYLELKYDTGNAELVADVLSEALSRDYDLIVDHRELDGVGECIRIEASVIKGTNRMADHLQTVYVIPAPDGCRIATIHCFTVESEGFSKRFTYMLNTLTLLEK